MDVQNRLKSWLTLFATGLAGLIVAIDFTIVNTCLSNIQYDLNMEFSSLQWIVTGFGLLFCALVVTMGRVGDIAGRRKVLVIGIIGFALTSYGAGSAGTSVEMIGFRILQGAFAAAVFPCGMAIAAKAFPTEYQGRVLGLYNSLLGIGLAFGPMIGSLIVKYLSWQWIFFINIPIAVVSLILCMVFVEESKLSERVSVDFPGVVLLTLVISSLTYSITQGAELGWTSLPVFAAAITCILSAIIFAKVELSTNEPLIPFHLFKKPGFIMGVIDSTGAIGFAWVVIFFMPLYLHNVLDKPTEVVGFWLLPMTVMTVLIPPIAGRFFDKKGGYRMSCILFAICIVGYALQYFLSVDVTVWFVMSVFILYGLAWGVGNGIGVPIALSDLENSEHSGLVSGAAITILNVFGIISLALANMIFSFFESKKMAEFIDASSISISGDTLSFAKILLSDPDKTREVLTKLSYSEQDITHVIQFMRESFVYGYQRVVLVLVFFSVLFFLFLLAKRRQFQTIRN